MSAATAPSHSSPAIPVKAAGLGIKAGALPIKAAALPVKAGLPSASATHPRHPIQSTSLIDVLFTHRTLYLLLSFIPMPYKYLL